MGHANYGRNTEEDEEIQEGWGHKDNIPDIGTNGANTTASLASNFPMAVMDDKKKNKSISKQPFDLPMEDKSEPTTVVAMLVVTMPAPGNWLKSYNIELVFPKDQTS